MKKFRYLIGTLLISMVLALMISCDTNNKSKIDEAVTTSKQDETTYEEVVEETDVNNNVIREAKRIVDPLNIEDISGYRDTDKSTYIEVVFSRELTDKIDGSQYIKIEPEIPITVSKVENKLIVRGNFDTQQAYNVTVLNGVKAYDGGFTQDEIKREVMFSQKLPKIMFSNDGIILPSVNDKKIYIRSLNVKKVNVIVKKVYENNITQFLQNFTFKGNGYFSSWGTSFENVGDELYNIDFDIENELDTWVQSAIDLTGILDNNGLYVVEANFDKKGSVNTFPANMGEWDVKHYINRNGKISKTILLTNIGIMAQKTDEGLHVNVMNITNNKPLNGTKVYLMSKNNQILEEKYTDNNGTLVFEEHKNSFYLLADDKNSKSILVLNNALNTNGFAVDGVYATNGIKGYIYTERGVYRPGNPIYVSIIARNNDKVLEKNQPVKISVFDPTGVKMVDNDVIKEGVNGFYTYTFKTDASMRTGIWKLNAVIGDETLYKDISVETVVPNKIKVTLDIPETVNYNEEIKDWYIMSNYLFGEPAGNLKYGVSFDIREEPIDFEKYKDYTFKVPSSFVYNEQRTLYGNLNNQGVASIVPDFSDLNFGSVNLLVDVAGRVTEDGGRNVVSKKYLTLKKYDTYIGIENTTSYRRTGEKLGLKAICVTTDGEKLVAGKNLKYRVYGNDHYWWWDYDGYDDFIRSFKSDKNTTLLEEKVFTTSEEPTLLDYELPKAEYLYVEIEDESTGQKTGINLQSSDWADPSVTKKVETLNISADKKSYNVGDIAEIRFKGAESSKALITIEKAGKIINQYVKDVNDVNATENLMITKEMAPNIYVYITLLQDYTKKENDRPLRLYGIIPISVIDIETKIDLEITAPDEIKPNEKFTVNIKNKNYKPVDFTIAVVDEGLLDITAFKTPSPWDYFFQKLATKITLYDNYSEIIDRPYGAINQILKVGGDESLLDEMARRRRLKELGLEDADRFTPVSMYKGVLTTDNNGEANVEFEMPSYMGSVRIMVVAANGNSYGSAEKNMLVKAPLVITPTLPRSMKIGDKMSIPVSVFALDEMVRDVEVYYTFKGNTQTKNLTMKKGEKQIVTFEEEIGNEIGKEKITIGAKSDVYNYEETVGMAINSNNAPIELSENKELIGNQEATFIQDNSFVSGTVNSILTISNKMMLGIDQRLKYLIKYPYGCAEQTTSSVFPQLFIEKLSTADNYKKSEIVDNINAGISRLKLFQLSNGSFSYWPGEKDTSDWATNYIGHFLIMAKKNGYYIPDGMYDKWLEYVKFDVTKAYNKKQKKYTTEKKCYELYLIALAGKPDLSQMNYMYENKFDADMTYIDKMYLAAAYKLAGEDDTARKISSTIDVKTIKDMYERINKADRYYYSYSYGSELREIAVYLDCYYTIYGKRDDEAFNELLNAMRTKNWYSTQTTAYTLIALSNVISDEIKEKINGIIELDGVQIPYDTNGQERIAIDENVKNVKVIPSSSGMTYVNYFWEGVPINSDIEDYADGFTIDRNYYDDKGKVINASEVKSGDTFWLEVVVKPTSNTIGEIENIALTQILPTGWEIENLRVNDSKASGFVEGRSQSTIVRYTDIRDDRVMWFFDHTNNSEYRFFVKINAVTKGEFNLPGTTLEAMYDNNYKAYKKGNKVRVN